MLTVERLSVRYGEKFILRDVSLRLRAGEWLMLIGPNGAGKSTLVNALSQGAPYTGQVLIDGVDARALRPAQLARRMGVLAQRHTVGYAFTVEEVVALGRYAHKTGPLDARREADARAVDRALEITGMTRLRRQSMLTLSGGELQRAFLAQVFAQEPALLLLDEPANHLDLKYQQLLFALIGDWLKTPGRAVLSVVHDLSLARAFGARALLLHQGQVAFDGGMEAALSGDILQSVYGMDVRGWMKALLSYWA